MMLAPAAEETPAKAATKRRRLSTCPAPAVPPEHETINNWFLNDGPKIAAVYFQMLLREHKLTEARIFIDTGIDAFFGVRDMLVVKVNCELKEGWAMLFSLLYDSACNYADTFRKHDGICFSECLKMVCNNHRDHIFFIQGFKADFYSWLQEEYSSEHFSNEKVWNTYRKIFGYEDGNQSAGYVRVLFGNEDAE